MIRRFHPQPTSQSILQRLLEPRAEVWVFVRHYTIGHPMQSYNLSDAKLSQLGHGHPQVHCQEASTPGQMVHNNPDCIMTS